jgi:hypothetical protein
MEALCKLGAWQRQQSVDDKSNEKDEKKQMTYIDDLPGALPVTDFKVEIVDIDGDDH